MDATRVGTSSRTKRLCRALASLIWATSLAAIVLALTSANAAVTFSGSSPSDDANETNSAIAIFDLAISGTTTNLVITLTNTAQYQPEDSADILTAVAFSIPGDPKLKPVSADLGDGSRIIEDSSGAFSVLSKSGNALGHSWRYTRHLKLGPANANEAIGTFSSWGFGGHRRFPGTTLCGQSSASGVLRGGITTDVDDGTGYDSALSAVPLIQDSAVFVLSGLPANFSLGEIGNVSFGYGTQPTQVIAAIAAPTVVVPEPNPLPLVASGIALLTLLIRRHR